MTGAVIPFAPRASAGSTPGTGDLRKIECARMLCDFAERLRVFYDFFSGIPHLAPFRKTLSRNTKVGESGNIIVRSPDNDRLLVAALPSIFPRPVPRPKPKPGRSL